MVSPRFGGNKTTKHSLISLQTSPPASLFILEAVTLITMTLITALIFEDLGVILTATGGTATAVLAYIMPPLVYMKLKSVSVAKARDQRAFSPAGAGAKRKMSFVSRKLNANGLGWLWPSSTVEQTKGESKRTVLCLLLIVFGGMVLIHTWKRICTGLAGWASAIWG
jgi:hypothetical protein